MVVESLIGVAIVPIIPSHAIVVVCSIHPHLDSDICPGRNLNHLAVKHDSEYFGCLIDLIGSYLLLELIAWVTPDDIFVPTEKVLLTRSEAIGTKAGNHDGPIRSKGDGVP